MIVRCAIRLRKLFGLEFEGDPFDESTDPNAITIVQQLSPAENGKAVSIARRQKTTKKSKKKQKTNKKETLGDCITLALLSDTHLEHNTIVVPDADVLLHAGDFGKWNASMASIVEFDQWLGSLPHKLKFVIAGNHDRFSEATLRSTFQHATFLQNEAVYIELRADGSVSTRSLDQDRDDDVVAQWKLHGHPQTPARSFVYRANGHSASLDDRIALCDSIADDVDILVSHAPPYGVLDQVHSSKHEGCIALRRRVAQIQPLLHVFGHCHGWGGHTAVAESGTTFVNAAQAFAEPVLARINVE